MTGSLQSRRHRASVTSASNVSGPRADEAAEPFHPATIPQRRPYFAHAETEHLVPSQRLWPGAALPDHRSSGDEADQSCIWGIGPAGDVPRSHTAPNHRLCGRRATRTGAQRRAQRIFCPLAPATRALTAQEYQARWCGKKRGVGACFVPGGGTATLRTKVLLLADRALCHSLALDASSSDRRVR